MIVTQIIELSKNRSKVYIDQEFAFVLYKGELRLHHIAEGHEMKEDDYYEIFHTILPKRAKLRAMNLLQKRTYTEKQLRDKLREGFYPEEILEEAISYVKSFHYVDDEQYALDYLNYNVGRKSLRQIEMDLYQKGISQEIYTKALSLWEADGGKQDEQEIIRELLEKKHYQTDCDLKTKQKVYGFLLRKGYSSDAITRAMRIESN